MISQCFKVYTSVNTIISMLTKHETLENMRIYPNVQCT